MTMPAMSAARQTVTARGPVLVLHPGDVVCAERGERIETLLGSCIAVVLTDPRRTLAAVCHLVHAGEPLTRPVDSARGAAHGAVAFDTMDALLAARGIQARLCEAYVYGGGNMFPQLVRNAHVGLTNARWTLALLEQRGIRVLAQDVGGEGYRRFAWTVGPGAPEVVHVRA